MAIEFVVETGSGLSTATSYISIEDFRQFWENKGKDYSEVAGYPDDKVKVVLNNAAMWMGYSFIYDGVIVNETQALEFPRNKIWDKNGIDVGNTVPKDVIAAQAFLAQYEIIGKSLDAVQLSGIKSKSLGPISYSFNSSIAAGQPQFKSAMGLLVSYIKLSEQRRRLR